MSIQLTHATHHNHTTQHASHRTTQDQTGTSHHGQPNVAQHHTRGSDRSSETTNQTTRKAQSIMYTILNNGTAVINCDDLQTAIRFVQSMESGLDRHTQHSPYTIVRAAE